MWKFWLPAYIRVIIKINAVTVSPFFFWVQKRINVLPTKKSGVTRIELQMCELYNRDAIIQFEIEHGSTNAEPDKLSEVK